MKGRVFLSHQSALRAIRALRYAYPETPLTKSNAKLRHDDTPRIELRDLLEASYAAFKTTLSNPSTNEIPTSSRGFFSSATVATVKSANDIAKVHPDGSGEPLAPSNSKEKPRFLSVDSWKPHAISDAREKRHALSNGSRDRIHVLVCDSSVRRTPARIAPHICGNIPPNSFCRVNEFIYIASPELLFVQMGEVLPLPQLIKLGFELCGSYSLLSSSERGFCDCPPATSARRIASFLERAHRIPGLKIARRAAQYLCDYSASPMETILAIILSLPPMIGGYGLPKPRLNEKVPLQPAGQKTLHQTYCRCDLFWPEHGLAVEYDSECYHSTSNQIARDSNRRTALALSGITTITATNRQVNDFELMEGLARRIAKELGKRERNGAYSFDERKAHLRTWLFQRERRDTCFDALLNGNP